MKRNFEPGRVKIVADGHNYTIVRRYGFAGDIHEYWLKHARGKTLAVLTLDHSLEQSYTELHDGTGESYTHDYFEVEEFTDEEIGRLIVACLPY